MARGDNNKNDNRGLASASKATRRRVAKMGGEARGEQQQGGESGSKKNNKGNNDRDSE